MVYWHRWNMAAVLFCFSLSCTGAVAQPLAVEGRLDAQAIDLKTQPVRLNGEWAFYPDVFLVPETSSSAPTASGEAENSPTDSELNNRVVYADVPEVFPGHTQIGSYRLTVRIDPAHLKGDHLAVAIYSMGTAFELYANGFQVTSAGQIGTDRASTIPAYHPGVYRIPDAAIELAQETGRLILLMRIAGFHYADSGFWSPIAIGEQSFLKDRRLFRISTNTFFSGAIFMIGLYHIAVFLLHRRRIFLATLYFGLSGVLIAIRNFLSGDRMFAYFFDVLDWHWQLRLELIAIYLAWPLFLTYLSHAFPRMLHRIPLRVVQITAAVFVLAAL
ncbi:MAG: hypothetical protein KDK27_16205, partial [Leptospiraceae bacterium]|nr:hypothetical protein [Leptospiraceae bacterium]